MELQVPVRSTGVERLHVRASRLAQLLDLFGLPSTARHLVERVEQLVGATDEVESRSAVVLETIADVQIEQLGG